MRFSVIRIDLQRPQRRLAAFRLAALVDRAKTKKLTFDDFSGGTFTVNNTGSLGTVESSMAKVSVSEAMRVHFENARRLYTRKLLPMGRWPVTAGPRPGPQPPELMPSLSSARL